MSVKWLLCAFVLLRSRPLAHFVILSGASFASAVEESQLYKNSEAEEHLAPRLSLKRAIFFVYKNNKSQG